MRIEYRNIYGDIGYGSATGTHVIENGQIRTVGPEGIVIHGGHGTLRIVRDAEGVGPNLTYLVPRAVSH